MKSAAKAPTAELALRRRRPGEPFIQADLLDTIQIGTIPVILGSGLPAFGAAGRDVWLDLEFAKPLGNGAVHSRYTVRKAD